MNTQTAIKPNFAAIKAKQQATWASGDYAKVGTTLQIVGETLCEAIDLRPGEKVLDVAAGNGNATLAAARRFADVTSTDYVPELLRASARRAEVQGLDVTYQVADAEALPFADESFDAVLSTFGVMFAPDQVRAATEMLRVTRTGGRIGMANWTAEGFIGQVFKTLGGHIAPPPGVKSPALWANEDVLGEMFAGAADVRIETHAFTFRYRSFAHFMDVFRTYYGPTHKAFQALGEKGSLLEADLDALHQRFNRDTSGSFIVPSEYAEVVVTK